MAHPLDHILPLAVQLRSDMTTLADVSLKVRKNGGSATTYNSGTTPAITQNSDITYGYELQIPASTYADGDSVEATWLYSGTPYAYEVEIIGPAAYAGGDTSGVTTLLTRIASALTITGGKVDVNDKTGFALTSAYDPAKTAAQAGDAMALTSGERTTLTASIWDALTSGLTTVGSVGKLFVTNIDAAISTRLAAVDYTAPDNADVAAIKAKTDNLPADPASQANLDVAVSTRLAAADYTAPDNDGTAILAAIATIPADVWDELLSGHVTVGSAGATLSGVSSSGDPWSVDLPGSYTGIEAGAVLAAVKAQTDLLPSDPASEANILTAISAIDVSAVAAEVWSYVRRTLTRAPRSEG